MSSPHAGSPIAAFPGTPGAASRVPRAVHRLARRAALDGLRDLQRGSLRISDGEIDVICGQVDARPTAHVRVDDPRVWAALLFGGTTGVADAYIRGHWTCDDLVVLFRIVTMNVDVMDRLERGAALAGGARHRIVQWLRRNTRRGARRNIHEHYDLGNELFRLFLDDTLTYSGAIFENDDASLRDAQIAKLDRLCRKLRLQPDDHLLEIGTGWGSLAIHAALRYGCRVTTTTLSRDQRDVARQRVAAAGLTGRVVVLLEDYRDLRGRFDKVVSVEMIEAVGHEYHGTFFRSCRDRLAPHGLMALQAITIADHRYESARRGVDFIRHFVFPGSVIPSVARLTGAMAATTNLRLVHLEDITPHYARTLAEWRQRFHARADEVHEQGFSRDFFRLWDYYLAYCQAGFTERYIGNVQMVFAGPGSRQRPFVAPDPAL